MTLTILNTGTGSVSVRTNMVCAFSELLAAESMKVKSSEGQQSSKDNHTLQTTKKSLWLV